MMHFFTDEFPCLSAGGLAFTRVFAGALDRFPFRHKNLLWAEWNRHGSAGIRVSL
jgi:hypothetical protein